MVQEAMTYLDSTPNMETKLELIDTLRTVTDGKVHNERYCKRTDNQTKFYTDLC